MINWLERATALSKKADALHAEISELYERLEKAKLKERFRKTTRIRGKLAELIQARKQTIIKLAEANSVLKRRISNSRRPRRRVYRHR